MKKLLVVSIVLAFAVPCLAQPPKPGPEVQKLAYWVGAWKLEGDVKANPFGPTGKMSETLSCEWFAGGFHLVCRGEGTDPIGKLTELDILSYDAEAKVYPTYAITSHGETINLKLTHTGNTWTAAAWEATAGGKPAKVRTAYVEDSPTSWSFKMEYSVAGGPWTVLQEGKATKVK